MTTRFVQRSRTLLSPDQRRALRRITDPWIGPIGSIRAADVSDAVALTYDDGPGPGTRPILEILKRHRATATFFVLVERAGGRA